MYFTRGVMVHKYDGSVRTSDFGTAGEKNLTFYDFYEQWFSKQVALSLNTFSYS